MVSSFVHVASVLNLKDKTYFLSIEILMETGAFAAIQLNGGSLILRIFNPADKQEEFYQHTHGTLKVPGIVSAEIVVPSFLKLSQE